MSYFYRLKIEYDGSDFFGWQKQLPVSERTIQSELEKVLIQITDNQFICSIGSGRTDAGVHALGQVVRIETAVPIACERILRGGNSLINPAIKILEVEEVSESFHPIYSAKSKQYIYLFSPAVSPFERKMVAPCYPGLDYQRMASACQLLIGEHDFKHFFCTGTPVKSTLRTIYSADLVRVEKHDMVHSNEVWQLSFVGSGFMKQMVRLLVGSLWQIGRGKVELDDLRLALTGNGPGKLGAVAPPQGLYLKEVHY